MAAFLTFDHVDAGYGAVKILKDLSFQVEEGSILGVIGPNGCGKTTMFNALIGLIIPTEGHIKFDGRDITKLPPNKRSRMGLGRTYQVPRPFENMTVFENVLTAAVQGGGENERTGAKTARDALELTGLLPKADVRAGELTLLDRKRLEIARALGTEPTLILLDEVAAGLIDSEIKDIMALVRSLKDERGLTVIWIEHVIETMVHSTDVLMCMSDGHELLIGDPLEVMHSKQVEEVYLGAAEEGEEAV
ncbi:MAG: ATP-binding cassette domain-containing protein [Clostridiales Family XIII bacterium]|jgi:branched-chain amino acid transport system ATP-binding protein|nr:ATP-binding cassette domain-containing protein [Clostridiales Family XIII bacterium]